MKTALFVTVCLMMLSVAVAEQVIGVPEVDPSTTVTFTVPGDYAALSGDETAMTTFKAQQIQSVATLFGVPTSSVTISHMEATTVSRKLLTSSIKVTFVVKTKMENISLP
jgi:hypothetical protein